MLAKHFPAILFGFIIDRDIIYGRYIMSSIKQKWIIISLFACPPIFGQTASDTRIYTSDIDRFWQAYDSVNKVNDTTLQKQIIQTLYMDKATPGLKSFMALRQHSADKAFKEYPALSQVLVYRQAKDY